MAKLKLLIVLLFAVNFVFALLFIAGKVAEGLHPALFETAWAGAIALCVFGFLITWILFCGAGRAADGDFGVPPGIPARGTHRSKKLVHLLLFMPL